MVRRNQSGVTLVEVMMVVVIVGIICMLAPMILKHSNQFFLLHRTKLELQREARSSISLITRNLRQAQSGTLSLDRLNTTQPYYSRLRFTHVDGSAVTFYQNGKTLYGTIGNANITLTKNLRYLAFTFPRSDDMTIVSVSMTLEKGTYQTFTKALHMASEKVRVMN
jgi:prepilin-type N-terminal cleavage/methylation domain-containing protein